MTAGLRAGVAHVELEPKLTKDFASSVSRDIGGPLDKQAKSSGQRFGATFGKLASVVAGAFVAKVGVDFFRGAIDGASDLNETVSKSRTIFGPASAGLEKWASGAATAIGQSKQEALDAAGTFGNMFTQLGIGTDKAAAMSTSMVELASDFASFHNADVSDVLGAQQAAFRGEYDALQRFLPLINAATVEQRALEMTHKKTTKELTAQEKALAVQKLMMEGAGAAAGDFARTSDGLANKQRIAAAQVANLKTKVGGLLLPIMTTLVGFLSDKALPAIERLGTMAGQVFDVLFKGDFKGGPFSEDSGFISSLFDARDAFLRFVDYVRANVLPVLGDVASFVSEHLKPILIGIGIAAALIFPTAFFAAIALAYVKFEGFRNVVDAVLSFFTGTVIPAVAAVARGIAEQFSNLVGWVRGHWDAIREAIGHVLRVIREVIGVFVDFVKGVWRAWGDDLVRVVKSMWETTRVVVKAGVDFVRSIIEAVLALINGDWGKAWDALKRAAHAAWDLIAAQIKFSIELVKGIIGGVLSSIGVVWSGAWDKVKGTVGDAWNGIRDTVSRGISDVVDFARRLPGRIVDTLAGLPAQMRDVGVRMFEGLIGGVGDLAGKLLAKVKDMVMTPVGWVKNFLGISSPSKLFAQFGQWTVQGFIDGIKSKRGALGSTVQEVIGGALTAVRSMLGALGSAQNLADAQRGLRDAQGNVRDLASDREDLVSSIAAQEKKIAALTKASAAVTTTEHLRILRANEALAEKTAVLRKMEEDGLQTTLDYAIATDEFTLAEQEVAAAITASTGKTDELLSAEAELDSLRAQLIETNRALRTSNDEIESAQRRVIEAQAGVLDSSLGLIGISPAFTEFFRAIAREAGLSTAAIEGMIAATDRARRGAAGIETRVATGTGLRNEHNPNATPSGSVRSELANIAKFVGETWSPATIDRIAGEIARGSRTIDSVIADVDRRINHRAGGGPTSGLTLVGEDGPELLATGPARVHSSPELRRMFEAIGDGARDVVEKHYELKLHGPFGNDEVDIEEQFRRMEILAV